MTEVGTTEGAVRKSLSIAELERGAEEWHYHGEYSQHSPMTIERRRIVTRQLLWFLRKKGWNICGRTEIKAFLAYLSADHSETGGRWDNERFNTRVKPRTVKTNFVHLRTFFNFLVDEEVLTESPMKGLKAARCPPDQIQPFTEEHCKALREAAKNSNHPKRDEAIISVLIDTGLRASELCGLKRRDIDFQFSTSRLTVVGKSNKVRTVPFGKNVRRVLKNYLDEFPRAPEDYIFTSDRGKSAGEPLTRSGLLQLIKRLAAAANIRPSRCSPHIFRHTFAVNFLRNNGHMMALKMMLGHTQVDMVERYVALADSDIENQHRVASPADKMFGPAK